MTVRDRYLLAAAFLCLGVMTWAQVNVWHSNLTLWAHAVRWVPCSPRAHANLSLALRQVGEVERADEQWAEVAMLVVNEDPRCPAR